MMRNLVVAKASTGMSTTVTMSGSQAWSPLPEPPLAASSLPAADLAPSASGLAPSAFFSDIADPGSAFQVHQLLEHLITGGDDARVGLVGALRDDEVGKLAGQIDVGQLQGARLNFPQAVGAGRRGGGAGRSAKGSGGA